MLSEWQEAAIAHMGERASDDLSIGAICGGLVGTIVCLLRTRQGSALVIGPFLSIVPSAVAGSLAGMFASVVIVFYYPLGSRGFLAPDFSFMLEITLVLIVSAMVAIFAPRESNGATGHSRQPILSSIVWAIIGAVVMGAVSLDYKALRTLGANTNAVWLSTISHALVGAIVAGGWRLLAELVVRKFSCQLAPYERKASRAAAGGESPWDRDEDE